MQTSPTICCDKPQPLLEIEEVELQSMWYMPVPYRVGPIRSLRDVSPLSVEFGR
ncbi:hypothetical protein CERSUDRAFT_89530 [Gelatoporia subvermispora B]|uniref:Uncharacterized protein n=1 Tax=Ceriporiopsis subvermispora (strain B) TaxID=914234 RepID=M2QG99_CERS8|nr:hypothetical protein CERSUDRAFT_89530 [Gelatoporia subvermispora B]